MAVDRALEPALQAGPLSKAKPSINSAGLDDLSDLEASLCYAFNDRDLLILALTHIGATAHRGATYQRLEFLGDRVLGVAVAAMLYAAYPEAEEGELSRRLADLVRRETCAEVAEVWGIDPHIRLAPGERAMTALRHAILGDLCESVIGAVFPDGGFEAAAGLVARGFEPRMRDLLRPLRDPKTTLQEWAQARSLPTPGYREVLRSGPDHAPCFTVAVVVEGFAAAEAQGPSKRAAEQGAASAFIARENIAAGAHHPGSKRVTTA